MSNLAIKTPQDLIAVAEQFAASGYFKDTLALAQSYVKISYGQELGISPFQAVSGIHVISGKPVLGAAIISTVIKRSDKYNYRVLQHTDTICEIEFTENTAVIGKSIFTAEDARKAGTQNMGKFPKNMLFARAMSNGAKWYCPDVFGGAVYAEEEFEEATYTEVSPKNTRHVEIAPTVEYNENPPTLDEILVMVQNKAATVFASKVETSLPRLVDYMGGKSLDELSIDQLRLIFRYLDKKERKAFENELVEREWLDKALGKEPAKPEATAKVEATEAVVEEMINAALVKKLSTILSKKFSKESVASHKVNLVLQYSKGRTSSRKQLTMYEAESLIAHLNTLPDYVAIESGVI